jgi:Leucine-rich repeat (LRR) protein
LSHLTNLSMLDLRDTGVSDLSPLSHLTNLSMLDLRDTKVRDISPIIKSDVKITKSW